MANDPINHNGDRYNQLFTAGIGSRDTSLAITAPGTKNSPPGSSAYPRPIILVPLVAKESWTLDPPRTLSWASRMAVAKLSIGLPPSVGREFGRTIVLPDDLRLRPTSEFHLNGTHTRVPRIAQTVSNSDSPTRILTLPPMLGGQNATKTQSDEEITLPSISDIIPGINAITESWRQLLDEDKALWAAEKDGDLGL
jgi:hypothetical protein